MTTPLLNDIVDLPDGSRQRVLGIANDNAWLILLDEPRALPHAEPYAWVCKGKLVTTQTKELVSKSVTASANARLRRDQAWERIKPLVADPAIFEPASRAKLLLRRSVELGCSENTLLLQLRRYWQRGQNLDALLPDFSHCGRTAGATRGRNFKDGRAPYVIGDKDKMAFKAAVSKHYFQAEHIKLTASYQWMLERFYSYRDGNGDRFINAPENRPTPKQLRLWLLKNFSLEYRLRKKKGDKDFERNHRHRLGSIQLDCHGAGHMYEIDATIADTYLVSSKDPTDIVGKPTLYLIVDRATRLIVGWYVGFENPSWPAAMQAILSIAEDKAAICKRYGIKYDPADWPAHGIQPEQFLADQGEMASKNAKPISSGLRSTISNVPGMRPDWKALVECGFKMIHQLMSPTLPAYDPAANQHRRRAKDYSKDACLTLEQFTALVVKAIITHNKTMQVNFDLSMEQVAAGIRPIPRELWTYEARARAGSLARFDADTVRMELLPRETVSVTDHGIQVDKRLFYKFDEGVARGWFVESRPERFKVVISRDHRLCDEVIVHDPDTPGRYYTAKLVKGCEKFKGMSAAEVMRFKKKKDDITAQGEPNNRQVTSEYNGFAEAITAKGQKALKTATGGKPVSRSARKADTAPAREAALTKERGETAGVPSQQMAPPPAPMSSLPPVPSLPSGPSVSTVSATDQPPPPANSSPSLKEKAAMRRRQMVAAA